MTIKNWFLLVVFLLLFFGGTILLPAYWTYYVIVQNGFWSLSSLTMVVLTALISYLSLDFIVEEWKETA